MTAPVELIDMLSRHPAPIIADACDGRGVLPTRIRPVVVRGTVAGPAYTMQLPPGDNLGIHIALSAAEAGSVLVAEAGDEEFGLWGAIASTSANESGLAAFVTDGFVRDRDEVTRLGFPVFARGICIRKTKKEHPGKHQVPIDFGTATVRPGDIIVGDSDGLLVVPPDQLQGLLSRIESIMRTEGEVLRGLREGKATLELLGLPHQEERPG